jgi:dihydroxyacetone kinase-like predicted kinase
MAPLRRELSSFGDSLVVVGGGGTHRVHVHTDEPDRAIAVAWRTGTPSSVSVTDLEGEMERCLAGRARGVRDDGERMATALVAVAEGEGLERILSSLGAAVVRGGPGHSPSVAELLRSIEDAPADAVVLLPNHPNVRPAAERAAAESSKEVHVVPSDSVPQGVAAAAAFHPESKPADNVEAMTETASAGAWGEVALAVRAADTPAGQVRIGDAIGFGGEEPVAVGEDPAAVAVQVVERLRRPHHEIVTIFAGSGVTDDDAESLEARLREAWPDLEVEFHRGDQPASAYLIGLE